MTKRREGTTASDDFADDRSRTSRLVTQRHYDPDGPLELTTAIVYAIAAARDIVPSEVKSSTLYDVVDAAALEQALFGSSTPSASRRETSSVGFEYEEYNVNVRSDGWIQIYE